LPYKCVLCITNCKYAYGTDNLTKVYTSDNQTSCEDLFTSVVIIYTKFALNIILSVYRTTASKSSVKINVSRKNTNKKFPIY